MTTIEIAGAKQQATILFVDDEPLSLKYFKAMVGKYANVKTASSPDAAIQILESEGDHIAVVVSDERMPRESGISFLSDVRKTWPSTVRVLTSAYANTDNLQQAINDAGIFRFVPKPWDLDELCTAMQEALEAEHAALSVLEPTTAPAPMTVAATTVEQKPSGDARDANLALLSIMASGLDAPLKSLSADAIELAHLGGQGHIEATANPTSYMESWSSRLRQSKMAACSGQVLKDVEHCRSLASSIARIARGLVTPDAGQTSSMADTLLEVIEQNTNGPITGLMLDSTRDFSYRVPREIMKFILVNLLRGSRAEARHAKPVVREITLFAGAAHNEVHVVLDAEHDPAIFDNDRTWRTIRSTLWACNGELLVSNDKGSGKTNLILCLPKTA